MSPVAHFDLAVIGGGCAGLSLARELATRHFKGAVLIIEPRHAYHDDRSWCFWATAQHELSGWVSHTWPQWLFSRAGAPKESRSCAGYLYQYIRSADFYQKSLDVIAQRPNIDIRLGTSATDIAQHQLGWRVTTTHATFTARQVIDTRPPPKKAFDKSTLFQSFVGVELQFDHAVVNAHEAELMTDMRVINNEFCFSYVLPFTPDRMLVECTFFSREPLSVSVMQSELDQILIKRGWTNAHVIRRESGHLPMGLPENPALTPSEPVRAGAGGGALRPSSGYGFIRIQRWAARCAQQLCEEGALCPPAASRFLLRHMDRLFLKVIRQNPNLAPILFERLFGRVDTASFIRFMDDRPNHADLVRIIACLPKIPFLKALSVGPFKSRQ